MSHPAPHDQCRSRCDVSDCHLVAFPSLAFCPVALAVALTTDNHLGGGGASGTRGWGCAGWDGAARCGGHTSLQRWTPALLRLVIPNPDGLVSWKVCARCVVCDSAFALVSCVQYVCFCRFFFVALCSVCVCARAYLCACVFVFIACTCGMLLAFATCGHFESEWFPGWLVPCLSGGWGAGCLHPLCHIYSHPSVLTDRLGDDGRWARPPGTLAWALVRQDTALSQGKQTVEVIAVSCKMYNAFDGSQTVIYMVACMQHIHMCDVCDVL